MHDFSYKVLTDRDILKNISFLDRAWEQEKTFFLLPSLTDVPDEWINAAMQSLPEKLQVGHFALLTSGSTGHPKIFIGSRSRAKALARVLHQCQDSESVVSTILGLPLSYCYGFVNQYVWSVVMGRKLKISGGFKDAIMFKRLIDEAENGMLCLVGPQVVMFEQNFPNQSFPGITRLHFAGGTFPQQSIPIVRRIFPNAKIFNNYGCTEAMPRLTLRSLEDSDDGSNIGFPLPGIEIKTDEYGHILFRSPFRAVAYFDFDGFKMIDNDQWTATGDLGHKLENGCWCITGRSDEVYKRYGEKITLPRLLNTVQQVWSNQAAFFREKDRSGEEGHVLVIAPSPKVTQVRSVLQAFRKNHPRTHWPLRLESIPIMPMLTNGKIDVVRLKQITTKKTIHWEQRI